MAAVILAAWGAGIGALVQRELTRSPADELATSAVRIAPVASYFTVRRGDRHAGFSSFTTDTIPDGLLFTDYTVSEDEQGRRGVRQVVVRASRLLALRDVTIGQGSPTATATVRDSTITVTRHGAGGEEVTTASFRAPLLVPSLVPLAVALMGPPDVGDTRRFDVFDPVKLVVRPMTVTVRAESTWVVVDSAAYDAAARRWTGVHADTVRAWRVTEDRPGIDTWVDELGRMVAAREPDGSSLRRTAYELAFENWRNAARAQPDSITPRAALAAAVPLSELSVRLAGLPLDALDAAGRWQERSGEVVRVTPSRIDQPHGYWIPPQRDFWTRFARELQVAPGIEVDAPLVVATSRRVRGREPDPSRVAAQLVRWVADSIVADDAPTRPSAVATLRAGHGGAAHHVHVFVAMARAAGLPARPVRGVVAAGQQLLSHVWAEVWLSGEWIPVDPTSGAFPASASHLRLVVGGVEAQVELDRLLQRAQLTILSAVPASDASR